MKPEELKELVAILNPDRCAPPLSLSLSPTHPSSLPPTALPLPFFPPSRSIPGKLVLITRYGAAKVASMLPAHIAAVKESGVPVVWQCDGVHGNTVSATAAVAKGLKTRDLDNIVAECTTALKVHAEAGTVLGGVHLELTGQKGVTECVGGACGVTEEDLPKCYETYCDPRLNYGQAIEAAFDIGDAVKA